MNKSDLKKLSKSELINLLWKQKKPKQKVVYNHDNLFNDKEFDVDPYKRKMVKVQKIKKEIDQQSINIDDKYQKIKPMQYENVEVYPIIKTSLQRFREDEIRISKDKNKAKKSFI